MRRSLIADVGLEGDGEEAWQSLALLRGHERFRGLLPSRRFLERGGAFGDGAGAGPFALAADPLPSTSYFGIGFRGVR